MLLFLSRHVFHIQQFHKYLHYIICHLKNNSLYNILNKTGKMNSADCCVSSEVLDCRCV